MGPGTSVGSGYTVQTPRSTRSQPFPAQMGLGVRTPPASHPGSDVDGVHALGQGALQVLQRVQALHLAAAAVDELPEGVLLQQGLHVLQEEALTEQGQFGGVVDLWGQGEGVRPQPRMPLPQGQGLGGGMSCLCSLR